MPTQAGFFSASNSLTAGQQVDLTGSTCADASGAKVDCSAPGANHVGGYRGPRLSHLRLHARRRGGGTGPSRSPSLISRWRASSTRSSGSGSSAVIRRRSRRCAPTPVASAPTARAGADPPLGGSSGTPQLGTKYGDAAIVEKYSEEGATLLKNSQSALPLDASSLNDGDILVAGANANHTVADPTNEASTGFIDRDAVNPLQQLKEFSSKPGAFTFAPANDPTGYPVPSSALSRSNSTVTGNLERTGRRCRQ